MGCRLAGVAAGIYFLALVPVGLTLLIGAIENRPTWIIRMPIGWPQWAGIYGAALAVGVAAAMTANACQKFS